MNCDFLAKFFKVKHYMLLIAFCSCCSFLFSQEIQFTLEEQQWLEEHPVIEFGYEPDWLPFEVYKKGKYSGIIGDYVKILERETGIKFKPIPDITWEETVAGLKSGEVDFTCCAGITDERKEYLNFTKPYVSSPMVIVTRKDGDFICGLLGLRGKTIAIPKNYYTGEVISRDYPEIIIDYHEDIESAIRAVSLGNAEAFVGNLVVVSYYIEHMGYSNLKIAAPTDYNKAHIGLAARKDWPELITICEKVFDQISYEEGNAILQKWMKVRYEYGVNMKKVWSYVLIIGSLVLIAFIIILLWNKSLKKEVGKRILIEKALESALIISNKKSEERKVLLQEIHHRVKNNLQIISSLLRLQKNESTELLEKKLNETITRVNAIALVHEKVYTSDNMSEIDLKQYIEELTQEIISSFTRNNVPNFFVDSNIENVDLKNLVPMALILNELVTNSLKYGVVDKKDGQIVISVQSEGETVCLNYSDNGKWLEPLASSKSFGHTLIDAFTEQLEGRYDLTTEKGTNYKFTFKGFHSRV